MLVNTKKEQIDTEDLHKLIMAGRHARANIGSKMLARGVKEIPEAVELYLGALRTALPLDVITALEKELKNADYVNSPIPGGYAGEQRRGGMPKLEGDNILLLDLSIVCGMTLAMKEELYNSKTKTTRADWATHIQVRDIHEYVVNSLGDTLESEYICKEQPISDGIRAQIEKLDATVQSLCPDFMGAWTLDITSELPLVRMCRMDNSILVKVLAFMQERLDSLIDGTLKIPGINCVYLKLAEVTALNLIKLVNKSSDTQENFFTGMCSSLTAEALVFTSDTEIKLMRQQVYLLGGRNTNQEVQRHGYGNMPYVLVEGRGLAHTIPDIARSLAIALDAGVSYGKGLVGPDCNYDMGDEVKALEEFFGARRIEDDIHDTETESATLLAFSKERKSTEKPYGHGRYPFGILSNHGAENTFAALALPRGVDLSNSFKAKYI